MHDFFTILFPSFCYLCLPMPAWFIHSFIPAEHTPQSQANNLIAQRKCPFNALNTPCLANHKSSKAWEKKRSRPPYASFHSISFLELKKGFAQKSGFLWTPVTICESKKMLAMFCGQECWTWFRLPPWYRRVLRLLRRRRRLRKTCHRHLQIRLLHRHQNLCLRILRRILNRRFCG